MKGLLLKDLYLILNYFRMYFLIAGIFIAISPFSNGNLFFLYYPCMLFAMIPSSLLLNDEGCKWETFSQTLPCTKSQLVSSKYLIGMLLQLAYIFLAMVIQAVRICWTGSFSWEFFLTLAASLLIMACVTSAIPLPLMFRYGAEKGRITQFLLIAVIVGGSAAASVWFGETAPVFHIPQGMPFLLLLASIGLYALSWHLSIRFYTKREVR